MQVAQRAGELCREKAENLGLIQYQQKLLQNHQLLLHNGLGTCYKWGEKSIMLAAFTLPSPGHGHCKSWALAVPPCPLQSSCTYIVCQMTDAAVTD